LLFILFLPLLAAGCFSERSFEMVPSHLARMPEGAALSTREWTARMHALAAEKLPWDKREGVTTDELRGGRTTLDVWRHFHLVAGELDSVFTNLNGVEQSAQVSSPTPEMVNGHVERAAWVGVQDVLVPVGRGGRD